MAFSTDYLDSGQAVLVRGDSPYKSLEDLSGKRVCAAADTTFGSQVSLLELRARAARWTAGVAEGSTPISKRPCATA
ncbi:transporter substrate-binding domain-containing protein [Actinomadura sp. LD22]|uniref:Transporter substrate-binding domain-containing protein n=1 Tax=Actinomadura physcomitrii TaxID=2650748 RepID=A0A6I4MLU2_9ACTN|nr:transporter substrate-binding domain-containing protein [Actinomadura physcomitrii]